MRLLFVTIAFHESVANPVSAAHAIKEAQLAADAIIKHVKRGDSGRTPIGGIGIKRTQQSHYVEKAWNIATQNAENTTYWCEIGFGSGQSTAAMLAAHSGIRTLTFDLFPRPDLTPDGKMGSWSTRSMFSQQSDAARFISERWPHRAALIAGNSNHTVPAFALRHASFKCDILSVDGWHDSPEVYWDIRNMRLLAKPSALLVLDDMERAPLRADLERAAVEGIIAQPTCHLSGARSSQGDGKHRFCVANYNPSQTTLV